MNTKLRVFQNHQDGDLLLRFVLEASSHDVELMRKFGDPEIEVGGTYFQNATLDAPVISEGGVIASVAVATAGAEHTYSPQRPVVLQAVGTSGDGAILNAVLTENGQLDSITVVDGGSGYSEDTVVRIVSGSHVTTYPLQKVKLFSGFPFTRRINTIPAGDASLAALAALYVAQIQTNVGTALAGLRALDTTTTDLTKEVVYQP